MSHSSEQPSKMPQAGKRCALQMFLVGAALLMSCGILLPCVQKVSNGEGWVDSVFHVRQCANGMRTYHEVYGHLPPTSLKDKAGRPLLSWRVAILPFVEQDGLYKQFHLDEPWDSAHNIELVEKMPRDYSTPPRLGRGSEGLTRLHIFTGPGTAFEKDCLTFDDFPDGLANTVLIVESDELVPWTKPEDFDYDANRPLPQFTSHPRAVHFLCRTLWTEHGFVFGFADGSARFVNSKTKESTIRALITRNGGEKVDLSDLK